MAPPLQVLVVDDSAVVRQLLSQVLTAAGMAVETAADPLIALGKMQRNRPDVVVLDIEMPRMDGLTFLRKLMAEDPLPVVICSGHAGRGTRIAVAALSEGAVEIVTKPRHGVRDFLAESAARLIDTIRAAAQARVGRLRGVARPVVRPAPGDFAAAGAGRRPAALVAVGASTGGPEALHALLAALPPAAPPVAIVQHMPEAFTAAFARHLDLSCRIAVREAVDGEPLPAGTALIAPGNRHLRVVRAGGGFAVRVAGGAAVSRHRPSVDVLFRSAAEAAGAEAVGVILTGMGDDGVEGLLAMRRAGAATVAQDEASSVVFGMPRAAIARGAAEWVESLERIPALLLALCERRAATVPERAAG